MTSGVKGQNWQTGGRPWKGNRQSNDHRLEPIITKEMTPDPLHFMYAEQTVASINSFITSLMQFVGSATSALTDLPAHLFLEHLVAPFLCFSALNSGIKVFFFSFLCTPRLFCCISAFYHLRCESCFWPCTPSFIEVQGL